MKYNTFNHENSKLNSLYENIKPIGYNIIPIWKKYKRTIAKKVVAQLTPIKKVEYSVNIFEKKSELEIDTTPVIYDLYNWLGITYSTGQGVNGDESPQPASAYIESNGSFYFKYPILDFRVPQPEKPHTLTGTLPEEWEYVKTVASVKTSIFIRNITEEILNHIKIKTYLYNTANEPLSNDSFSELYRWNKESNGYTFNYNAFFTIEQENSQLLLYASLILDNPKQFDTLQKIKLK